MDVYWQCEDCDSTYDPSPGVFCPFCGGQYLNMMKRDDKFWLKSPECGEIGKFPPVDTND